MKYYKLTYIGHISTDVKCKRDTFCSFYRKNSNVNIVLTSLKVADVFHVKDLLPQSLKWFIVYKSVCPDCDASFIRETTHHLSTRIKKHLKTDKKSHIFENRVKKEGCWHLALKLVLK